MACRKIHSDEDMVRKLGRADDLAAELEVSTEQRCTTGAARVRREVLTNNRWQTAPGSSRISGVTLR